ncbi:hypothetical protein O181_091334 [Austropuccinia psidii MF-1]|uniref:Uncharacterized protein n=1 Tax=Austropuccinia psidii MF-1 TaxID=1389203 RepID=A0A9Q3IXD4_9BASI|nr:hypothetical protein [Austropuccinia psidii MF-1]
MKELTASMDKVVKTLQEGHAQLRKASEETKKRLNIVFEEQHHSRRDRDCLDPDINKLFNVYHNMKSQPQGHVMDNPYHPDEIKPMPWYSLKTTPKKGWHRWQRRGILVTIVVQQTNISTTVQRQRKQVYAIEKVPEEESPTKDYESDSMGYAIREPSDDDQDPREEFLMEYQEETPLEIQDIQFEAGMPQDTANKNLCKHTQDAQTFLVTPTRGMAYIHGTATKMTVCIDKCSTSIDH